ncbi:MAG: hypothetical protein LBL58_00685 [Tannerellaceae bacterium]|jgi:carbonic anhydrase|nr:hypothetical protein [Tannerellaceae bacterium]
MKHKFFLFAVLSLLACVLNAQTAINKKVIWDYPVKPGSDEWRETSYNEKIQRSQPSKDIMNSWNTETLFQYCIDYPFNKAILLFNNPNEGFKNVYEQSSVWKEFIQREDAISVFMKHIELRPYEKLFKTNKIEERNNELFILFFLDKIVSETNFAANLDLLNRKKLAKIILQNHQNKEIYPEEFTGFHYNSSLSAILKILATDGISSEDEISQTNFRNKTNDEYFVDEAMDSLIIKETINYINK